MPDNVDQGLAAAGFSAPFAIQTEAIPVAMRGLDVCGRARTGSGKTLAFGVPMLARADKFARVRAPRGLVLVPTRELALQVAEVLQPIGKECDRVILPVYGGASRDDQIDALEKGVDMIVATPLRLIDLMKAGELVLDDIQVVTLDEADRMADDGFTPQVEWILRHVTGDHQTMLFSATLDGQVGNLVKRYMKSPEEVSIDSPTDTVGTMHHLFLGVHKLDKDKVVAAIATSAGKTVVFCDTKRLCDRVTEHLQDLGINALAIHGDLTQAAREKQLSDSQIMSYSFWLQLMLPHAESISTTLQLLFTTYHQLIQRRTCIALVVLHVPDVMVGLSLLLNTTSTQHAALSSVHCV